MQLFSPPPETRYDLRISLAGIPIRVHPLFWVMTLLLGGSAANPLLLLLWVAAVFVSITVHELGHAAVMKRYGVPSRIVLHIGGGLTVPESVPWGGRWLAVSLGTAREIMVSLAGSIAGFLFASVILGGCALAGGTVSLTLLFGVLPFPVVLLPTDSWIIDQGVSMLIWINVFWGAINLMPVYPLDGGRVARLVLLTLDPLDGVNRSLWVSVLAGGLLAVLGILLFRSLFITLMYGFLAFQSYQALQGRSGGWA
jgi:Zn-dependent protease